MAGICWANFANSQYNFSSTENSFLISTQIHTHCIIVPAKAKAAKPHKTA
nr:MAG TPA_asm: hypothetical protein [Caudoviricetes sp.]